MNNEEPDKPILDEQGKRKGQIVLDRITSNWGIILFGMIIVLICLITLYNLGDAQQQCNEHWIKEFEKCSCACKPSPLLNSTIYSIPGVDIYDNHD